MPDDTTAELRELRGSVEHHWPGEWCKRCRRRNVIGFSVPHAVWRAVVDGRWSVVCPACFDEEAQSAGIVYAFDAVFPVSWSQWLDAEAAHG